MQLKRDTFDVIVVGVGGIGSAAVCELAERGQDVLGLERYSIPHSKGSSHGYTRIIRKAYHENPQYVSMVNRAYDLWEELQEEYGEQLLYKTGSLTAGPRSSELVQGALEACEKHSIQHEILGGGEACELFPGFQLPSEFEAVYQPAGGFLRPEQSTVAHVELAHRAGATIRAREEVTDWQSTTDGVKVTTNKGQYEADRLVFAAGPWTKKVVESVGDLLTPERQVVSWIQPETPDNFVPENFPVFLLSNEDNIHYGIPIFGVPGVKFGRHYHLHEQIDPDRMKREATDRDERILRDAAHEYLDISNGKMMGLETCIYTNTPDYDFMIDTLPNHSDVVVLGGFSGHGYKFARVIGEIAGDLIVGDDPEFDISPFSINR
jgi:sarcosine oxidase